MTVTYVHRFPPAAEGSVVQLEERIGHRLPPAYRDYLREQGGGRVENNAEALNTILGIGDLPDWADIEYVLDLTQEMVPSWLFPVARDEYGNLYCLSLRDEDSGAVWFWNHEEEDGNLTLKAPDWCTFLESVEPLPVID